MKKLFTILALSLFFNGYAVAHSVIVNLDGTHSTVVSNGSTSTLVNPDGTHSTVSNSNATTAAAVPNNTDAIISNNAGPAEFRIKKNKAKRNRQGRKTIR